MFALSMLFSRFTRPSAAFFRAERRSASSPQILAIDS
jgi:hypothetical protein